MRSICFIHIYKIIYFVVEKYEILYHIQRCDVYIIHDDYLTINFDSLHRIKSFLVLEWTRTQGKSIKDIELYSDC